jgi:hypothetical protein
MVFTSDRHFLFFATKNPTPEYIYAIHQYSRPPTSKLYKKIKTLELERYPANGMVITSNSKYIFAYHNDGSITRLCIDANPSLKEYFFSKPLVHEFTITNIFLTPNDRYLV